MCDPDSGLMGPDQLKRRSSARNQPANAPQPSCPSIWPANAPTSRRSRRSPGGEGLAIIDDSCHAIGSTIAGTTATGMPIGACARQRHDRLLVPSGQDRRRGRRRRGPDSASPILRDRMERFRSHGVDARPGGNSPTGKPGSTTSDANPWYYEMVALGLNYRLSDINCALASSQLGKLDRFVAARRRPRRALRFAACRAGAAGAADRAHSRNAVRPGISTACDRFRRGPG